MKNTLRLLLKDLAKVTGKKRRSRFGKEEKPKKKFRIKGTKEHYTQKKSKDKSKDKDVPSSKRKFLKKIGKAALWTGGTIGSAAVLHHMAKVYGSKYEKINGSSRYDELNRRNESIKQNPQSIEIYMKQNNPNIRKILKRHGFNPDFPPSDIGFKKYWHNESRQLHSDKSGNSNYNKYKGINTKSKENKLAQLNDDYDILKDAGYSFGNKTKLFLKKISRGMWNNKFKILGLSSIAAVALATGRERGRIDRFSKTLSPEERKDMKNFIKEFNILLNKYKQNKNEDEFHESLKILTLKYERVYDLIKDYFKTYHPNIK